MTATQTETTVPTFTDIMKFKIAKQDALPKWMQTAMRNALTSGQQPPNELRFQCRIATDARDNFERVEMSDGCTYTLHPRSKPQFGKTVKGDAYLTVVIVNEQTGVSYRVQWLGDDVPLAMQRTAVQHDMGVKVPQRTVQLDFSKAKVTPSEVAGRNKQRNAETERARYQAEGRKRDRRAEKERGQRRCARLTAADLA